MENWVNGTIREINETDHGVYYSIQSRDPLLSNCEPTILFDEVKVRTDKNFHLNLFQRSFIPYSRKQKHVLLFRKSEIWLFKVSITSMPHTFFRNKTFFVFQDRKLKFLASYCFRI